MALFGSSDDDLRRDDLRRRIKDLERRVAALERAAFAAGRPVPPTPVGEPSETWASGTVRSLAMQGKKIEAIKLLREETGLGHKQAKNIVDRL